MRVLLVVFASLSGYFIGAQVDNAYNIFGDHKIIKANLSYLGVVSGFIIAILTIFFEKRARKTPLRIVIGGAFGLIIGLIVANLLTYPLVLNILKDPYVELVAYLLINSVFGYMGLNIGMKKGDEFKSRHLSVLFDGAKNRDSGAKILDTSVIIDGRIADICESGFLEGNIIIPQFVLGELQHIADSSDPVKRTRGKRGLDILQRMQKEVNCNVSITDQDFQNLKEVDAKLIALARALNAKVVTNDSNLNKIAGLQGVSVLNINQLAAAMRPAILPGEVMNILVFREGKEQGQGIGYLDDGTMVVIDNARRHMGKNVDVAVTSVLQTSNGRMIFSKLKEELRTELSLSSH
ncbi:MAG: TRAM domain-containing protein [Deltaproteobacteria bacterium]|nr:TRAM domain-containing protein [Deltaproteobacteria bacterium]